ncbi:MAG: DUF1254 domain-containing protein [Thermoleophilia bacterium]
MAVTVSVENFVRAETDRMFAGLQAQAGGVNQWGHFRAPTPLNQQTVIRMNRDTLYSWVLANISKGATLTIPDPGGRYASVMLVNQDHYINRVLHQPGEYELTTAELDTPFVLVAVRTLIDPADPDDLAAVNALQDQFQFSAGSSEPFSSPNYDEASLDATRQALLELARGLSGFDHAFGTKETVDPIRHLIGSAAGWGGLPDDEAVYINVDPGLPVGEYQLTVRDVPVDAFWSISLYNADGYFEPNDRHANSVNSITAGPNDDGSITVSFGGCDADRPNCLPIMEGWNYIVRLYQPHSEILDGSWKFPSVEAAEALSTQADGGNPSQVA